MTKIRYACLMMMAAIVPVGCMTTPASMPSQVALSNPLPLINLGNNPTGEVTVGIGTSSRMRTQAQQAKVRADVSYFEVELVTDQGNTGTSDYTDTFFTGNPTQRLAAVFFDNDDAFNTTVWTGSPRVNDTTANGQFKFTGLMAGTYRIRVRAKDGTTAPGGLTLNKPETWTSNASGWKVSRAKCTISAGAPAYADDVTPSAATNLAVNLDLLDAVGDDVQTNITVTPGSTPAVGWSDN